MISISMFIVAIVAFICIYWFINKYFVVDDTKVNKKVKEINDTNKLSEIIDNTVGVDGNSNLQKEKKRKIEKFTK